ncbi:MAG: UDP-N-acetylmuramoyl-tripeptide--D-alanyl-D-alanine ligase [Patescibacteria group bacterium]|nr:UDP-N-acetylmuramoyl-tripeptide--D-alanyl-D-alanine ligase [Patescibacteria group bacterium]
MRKILQIILRQFTVAILKKYQPEIVGIAGSVGKTSAKEAIFSVLSLAHNCRRNIKSYNNEIGLPLTIIGVETAGRSLLGWLKVFGHASRLLISKDEKYPEILILEMGADKLGDIEYLVKMAPPKIGVLTAIAESHLQVFKDLKGVLKEKEMIVTDLPREGVAILNADDENVMSLKDKLRARVITFGFAENTDVKAGDISFSGLEQDFCETQYEWDCKTWGTSLKVSYAGSFVPVFLPHTFGKQNVYSALAAFAVGVAHKINLVDIAEGLKQYRAPKGRMNLIAGLKHTLIIDDTYNSSPVAVKAALAAMKSIILPEGRRKIVVLGDMLELGEKSSEAHREIGFKIAEESFDYLFAVGKESKATADAAVEAGMNANNADRVKYFEDSEKAGVSLQNHILPGDLILVKGSQGMRMENIVKEIMAEPEKAKELLVRQTGEWEKR